MIGKGTKSAVEFDDTDLGAGNGDMSMAFAGRNVESAFDRI